MDTIDALKLSQHEHQALPFDLWDKRAVQDQIGVEFGLVLLICTMGAYLKCWCDTPQCPNCQTLKRKPRDIQHRLQEVYPLTTQGTTKEDGTICCADKTTVAQDVHSTRGYFPVGHTCVFGHQPSRGVTMISAISSMCLITLIFANLMAHHAKEVALWLQAQTHMITVFYLQSYIPQINPDEYLNRNYKTNVCSANFRCTSARLLNKFAALILLLVSRPERMKTYYHFTHKLPELSIQN